MCGSFDFSFKVLIAYKLLLFAQSFELAAVATVVLLLSSCGVALEDIFENCLVFT